MKNILLPILIILVTSCNSQKKEKKEKNIVEYACECITVIPENGNTDELVEEARKCISESYEVYSDYVESLADKYFEKNPNADIEEAQNWIREVVVKKLVQSCSRYKEIASKVAFEKKSNTNDVKDVAKSICKELNQINPSEFKEEFIDSIFMKHMMLNRRSVQEKYSIDVDDLVQELVSNCEIYRKLTANLK